MIIPTYNVEVAAHHNHARVSFCRRVERDVLGKAEELGGVAGSTPDAATPQSLPALGGLAAESALQPGPPHGAQVKRKDGARRGLVLLNQQDQFIADDLDNKMEQSNAIDIFRVPR